MLRDAPCACGRTSARIAPILRRTDHRLTISGIPLYPEQVESLLRGIDPILDDFRLIVTTQYGIGEQLELQLVRSANQDFPGGNCSKYLDLLRSHIRRVLGLSTRIQLVVAPEHLPQEGLTYKTVSK